MCKRTRERDKEKAGLWWVGRKIALNEKTFCNKV